MVMRSSYFSVGGCEAGKQESRKAGKQESRKAGKQESRKAGIRVL
jgi:hypothetical protein